MCNTDRQCRMYCLPICSSWLTESFVISAIKRVWGKGDVELVWILFFACFSVYYMALGLPLLSSLLHPGVHIFVSANCKENLWDLTLRFVIPCVFGAGGWFPCRAAISWLALQGWLIGQVPALLPAWGALLSLTVDADVGSAWTPWEGEWNPLVSSWMNVWRCRFVC